MLRMHCPRALLLMVAALSVTIALSPAHAATCYGDSPCNACKTCRYCKHCAKEGGTCGVCAAARRAHQRSRDKVRSSSSKVNALRKGAPVK
jgi:hypothetical protein